MGFANVREGLAISAGSGSVQTGWVSLANSNGVSFGAQLSAGSLVITASAQTIAGGVASYSAGSTQITSGTAVLSNVSGILFGVNGQTITAALAGIQYWDNSLPLQRLVAPDGTSHQILGVQRVSIGLPLTVTRGDLLFQISNLGALSAPTTVNWSLSLLVYTFNRSTLSLASSGTVTGAYVAPGGGAAGGAVGFVSMSLGTWVMTPGEYVLGTLARGGTSIVSISSLTNFTVNCAGSKLPSTILNPGGGNFSPYVAVGTYASTTSVAPNSFQLSEIVQTFTLSNAFFQ